MWQKASDFPCSGWDSRSKTEREEAEVCSVTAGETGAPEGSALCGARAQNSPKPLPRPTLPELAEHLPRAGPRAASGGGAVSRRSRCKSLPKPQMFLPQSVRDTGTAQQDLKFSGGPGASPREGQLQAGSWGRIQDRRAEPEHSQGGGQTCIPTQLAQLSATPREHADPRPRQLGELGTGRKGRGTLGGCQKCF